MISHTTIKADGKDNEYDIKFSGASIGRAVKTKIDVKTGDKTKSTPGFSFTPSKDFEKVGGHTGATMKELKEAIEKATAAAGLEAPKKADPMPTEAAKTDKPAKAAKAEKPTAKAEPALAAVKAGDDDIDL